MSGASSARLLIASLGNPAPYLETRHSAGHTLLKALAQSLSASPLTRSREYGKALVATSFVHPDWLLWQSPSFMNVSGPPLGEALQAFSRNSLNDRTPIGIVVIHDELESPPGMIKERAKNTSHKGHNGLKSLAQTLRSNRQLDQLPMIKIGVGIGRPEGRGGDEVSNYVLKKTTWEEKKKIEEGAARAMQLIEAFAQKIGKGG